MAFISINLVLTVEKEGLFIRWHARRMISYSGFISCCCVTQEFDNYSFNTLRIRVNFMIQVIIIKFARNLMI